MNIFPTRFNKNLIFAAVAGIIVTPLFSLFLLQVFAAVLFLLFIFDTYGSKLKSFDVFAYLIAVFALLRIISILLSEYPSVSLMAVPKEILFYASFFALMYYLKVLETDKLLKLLDIAIWAGCMVALIGMVFFVTGSVNRAQSFGSGYSTFSTYLMVILAFRLAREPGKELKEVLIWSGQTGLILSGIILSMGRTNIAIAVLICIAMAFILRMNYKPVIITTLITVILVLVSLQFNSNELDSRVDNPLALSDRDIIYKGVEMLYKDHPFFGHGPRTFHNIFPLEEQFVDTGIGSWHNEYIQTYLESGVFSLIVLLLLFFVFFLRTKTLIFNKVIPKDKRAIFYSSAVGIAALMLAGLTGAFLYSPVLSIIFGFLLSLFSAVDYMSRNYDN